MGSNRCFSDRRNRRWNTRTRKFERIRVFCCDNRSSVRFVVFEGGFERKGVEELFFEQAATVRYEFVFQCRVYLCCVLDIFLRIDVGLLMDSTRLINKMMNR